MHGRGLPSGRLERAGVRHHREAAFALGVPRVAEFEKAVKTSRRTLLVLSPAYFSNETVGTSTCWPKVRPGDLHLAGHPAGTGARRHPTRLAMLTRLDPTDPEEREAALAKLSAVPAPAPGASPPALSVPWHETL